MTLVTKLHQLFCTGMHLPHTIASQAQVKLHERNPKSRQTKFCTSIRVEQKQTVMHYQPAASLPFLRIGLATPNLVPQCKGAALSSTARSSCRAALPGLHYNVTSCR